MKRIIILTLVLVFFIVLLPNVHKPPTDMDPCKFIRDSLELRIKQDSVILDSLSKVTKELWYLRDSLESKNKEINSKYEKVVGAMGTWSDDQHAVFFSAETDDKR